MRRIARYFSVFVSLPVVVGLAMSLIYAVRGEPIRPVWVAGILVGVAPIVLAAVVLGPKTHRWERFARWGNRFLTVVAALAFAWAVITPGERSGVYLLLLSCAALNWIALAESDRTKIRVALACGAWAFAFVVIASYVDSEAARGLTAAVAAANTWAIYMICGAFTVAVLMLGERAIHRWLSGRKDAPDSRKS